MRNQVIIHYDHDLRPKAEKCISSIMITLDAGPAVEGSVRVDADRVLDAAAVVHVALVDVVADLPLARSKVETHTGETGAA